MKRLRTIRKQRGGNIIALAAFLLMFSLILVAFAVDFGYLLNARTEMQRTADAGALAGCWELMSDDAISGEYSEASTHARTVASVFAGRNKVCNDAPAVDLNASNSAGGEVVVGYLSNPFDPAVAMDTTTPSLFNAVQVRVLRTSSRNGLIPYFFARVMGHNGAESESTATAALLKNIKGFETPADGGNLGILPFALDVNTWNGMLAGGGTDSWHWNDDTDSISAGADGVREVNLYPQGTGSPGNRGTIDIGSSNNSTADIARQILYGVSPSDLAHHGGKLELNAQGVLHLNGDTGISAGVKDELASIKGQPRIIPIFQSVVGPGNNADYTIVQFAGVRILDVKLTGAMSQKKVTIQPARVITLGAIRSSTSGTSDYIFSPVALVR